MLESERFVLRKILLSDVDDVYEIYSKKEMYLYVNSDIDISSDSFSIKKEQVSEFVQSWENDSDLICWGNRTENREKDNW